MRTPQASRTIARATTPAMASQPQQLPPYSARSPSQQHHHLSPFSPTNGPNTLPFPNQDFRRPSHPMSPLPQGMAAHSHHGQQPPSPMMSNPPHINGNGQPAPNGSPQYPSHSSPPQYASYTGQFPKLGPAPHSQPAYGDTPPPHAHPSRSRQGSVSESPTMRSNPPSPTQLKYQGGYPTTQAQPPKPSPAPEKVKCSAISTIRDCH